MRWRRYIVSECYLIFSVPDKHLCQVLNDVYQYHLPPVRRIPPLVWARVRSDLKRYFTERSADGVSVLCWYHRQFAHASRERYLRNVNILLATHAQLADYFLGVWGGGVLKPFEYTSQQRQRFGLESTHEACDRKVFTEKEQLVKGSLRTTDRSGADPGISGGGGCRASW